MSDNKLHIQNIQDCEIIYGYDVPDQFKDQFDYMDNIEDGIFFTYDDEYYDLGEVMRLDNDPDWDGVINFTVWSGLLIKINESCDGVKVAYYYS